jgi:hypothetical protein
MKAVQKTYGPLPLDRAGCFDDYLQQVVGPDDYRRREIGSDVYFDLAVMPSSTVNAELENLIAARASGPTWEPAERGPQFRETRINVYDSSRADPWSAASGRKRQPGGPFDHDFKWNPYKS